MLRNLYFAYAVTWIIIGIYLVILWRRQERVNREEAHLKR